MEAALLEGYVLETLSKPVHRARLLKALRRRRQANAPACMRRRDADALTGYLYLRVAFSTIENTPASSRATTIEMWRLMATSACSNCWPVVFTSVA